MSNLYDPWEFMRDDPQNQIPAPEPTRSTSSESVMQLPTPETQTAEACRQMPEIDDTSMWDMFMLGNEENHTMGSPDHTAVSQGCLPSSRDFLSNTESQLDHSPNISPVAQENDNRQRDLPLSITHISPESNISNHCIDAVSCCLNELSRNLLIPAM